MSRFTLLLLLFFAGRAFGQEAPFLLQTDSTWTREVFAFPLSFAPSVSYSGTEEAVFPPGWSQPGSSDFWSYAFVWNIDTAQDLTEKELTAALECYFDGLTGIDGTSVQLRNESPEDGPHRSVGEVVLFDAFFTQQLLTLHMTADQYTLEKRLYVLFRFSPQKRPHEVWTVLEQVVLLPPDGR